MRLQILVLAATSFALPAEGQGAWHGSVTAGYANALGEEFGGGGSGTLAAAVYRRGGRGVAIGFEAGHTRFGSNTTRVLDGLGPGTELIEEFGWSAWHAAGVVRLSRRGRAGEPFVALGAGAYWTRSRDRIEGRDARGARIPAFDFLQTRTQVNPGVTIGVGIDFPPLAGPVRLGAEVRWHGILAVAPNGLGLADFAAVGVRISLN